MPELENAAIVARAAIPEGVRSLEASRCRGRSTCTGAPSHCLRRSYMKQTQSSEGSKGFRVSARKFLVLKLWEEAEHSDRMLSRALLRIGEKPLAFW